LKFLSFLSHDLNNNLNSVTMTLQMHGIDLKRAGGFAEAEASLASAEQMIHNTVAGMRRMLDHARLRKLDRRSTVLPMDLRAFASNIISHFGREAAAKGVTLENEIRPGAVIESDPGLLSLVLQNLVGNGVKYSAGGSVHVGFADETQQDSAVIRVSDEGPGIAPEKIAHIFDAFERGDSHGQQGLGLGLAIASEAAKFLGTNLTVESKLGIGTTFRLTLARSSALNECSVEDVTTGV
jgi:signal transduction histidine kinase